MKKSICAILGLAAILVATGGVQAGTTTVTASPDGVANVIGSTDSVTGFDPGSWQGNATAAGQKAEYYVTPQQLFGRDVTVSELTDISYFTQKNTTHAANAADWFMVVYTKPDPNLSIPHGSWYGNRINAEPYFSANISETPGTWTEWNTGASDNNRLRFFDSTSGYFGGYGDGFLSDLTANTVYGNQQVLCFSIQTGSAWANGFTGLVDGLSIEVTGGDIGQVNFVPEPATMSLLALGGLAVIRRRRAGR